MKKKTYSLLDSGGGRKLERFGEVELIRPSPVAVWERSLSNGRWRRAAGEYLRDPGGRWEIGSSLPESWEVELCGLRFIVRATDFGHLGLFPEHSSYWPWMEGLIERRKARTGKGARILNLFAYSGGATLAAARAGGEVVHLDASRGMVAWARENADLNGLSEAPIRWIVDDALKFLKREARRGGRYDGIILDPPTFGRGRRGEVFKLDDDAVELLRLCRQVMSDDPLLLMFCSHTPGYTSLVLERLLEKPLSSLGGQMESGELLLPGEHLLPSGCFAKWWSSDDA